MKIKLVTAAVLAGCAGAVYAQSSVTQYAPTPLAQTGAGAVSSVTLYGMIDAGVLHQSASGPAFLTPANSHTRSSGSTIYKDGGIYGNAIGVKGSEDIGNGYKVNYKFQGQFNTSTGALRPGDTPEPTMFNQYAMVGVSGPFGSLDAGRQVTPMIWAFIETDARHAQYFGSIFTAFVGMNQAAGWVPSNSNIPIGAVYDSSAVVYHSPSFGGVTLDLEYAFGNAAQSTRAGSRESVVLKYAHDGLHLAASYYNGRDTNPYLLTGGTAPLTGQNNNRFYYLGALYTIKGFTVSTSYSVGKNPADPSKANMDLYSLGFGYRFSPAFEITTGIYHIKSKGGAAPGHSTAFSVAANYNLSKRTMLYAVVGRVTNKGDTMNQMLSYGTFTAPNASTNAFMLGVQHFF